MATPTPSVLSPTDPAPRAPRPTRASTILGPLSQAVREQVDAQIER